MIWRPKPTKDPRPKPSPGPTPRPIGWLLSGRISLQESPTSEQAIVHTSMVGVSDKPDTILRGPAAPAYSRTAGSLRGTRGVRP